MSNMRMQYNMDAIDEESSNEKKCPLIAPPARPPTQSSQAQKPPLKRLDAMKCFDGRQTVKINDDEFNVYTAGEFKNTVYLCVHGAGFSGLSFAFLAGLIKDDGFVIAPDLRGHGFSTKNGQLEFKQLVNDVLEITLIVLKQQQNQPQGKYRIVLIGHSLGGSVVSAIHHELLEVLAVIQIDISEHTAISSLSKMSSLLRTRNRVYASDQDCLNFLVKSGTLQNKWAAIMQIPGWLGEDMMPIAKLVDSEGCWKGWFEGMNTRFIESAYYKQLVISNFEKLDKDHEIAHMQGKLDVEVVRGNHNLHEDSPVEFVETVQRYLRRLHFTQNLCGVPFDFKQPLSDEEKPEPKQILEARYQKMIEQ